MLNGKKHGHQGASKEHFYKIIWKSALHFWRSFFKFPLLLYKASSVPRLSIKYMIPWANWLLRSCTHEWFMSWNAAAWLAEWHKPLPRESYILWIAYVPRMYKAWLKESDRVTQGTFLQNYLKSSQPVWEKKNLKVLSFGCQRSLRRCFLWSFTQIDPLGKESAKNQAIGEFNPFSNSTNLQQSPEII